MAGVYWYLSRDKIEALREYGKSRVNWVKDLSFALKSPFAEASTTLRLDSSLFELTDRIERRLRKDGLVEDYANEVSGGSVFFSFEGHAQRTIEEGAYWIAMRSGETALLLAGSVTNAIGGPVTSTQEISPSVDPLGAIRSAFEPSDSQRAGPTDSALTIGERCSYVWQAIARPVRRSWADLPYVEGIAVYAGKFATSRPQMQRGGFKEVTSIVVGSPIFVRQC